MASVTNKQGPERILSIPTVSSLHLTEQLSLTFCLPEVSKAVLCVETHLTIPTHEAWLSTKPGWVIFWLSVVSPSVGMQA